MQNDRTKMVETRTTDQDQEDQEDWRHQGDWMDQENWIDQEEWMEQDLWFQFATISFCFYYNHSAARPAL